MSTSEKNTFIIIDGNAILHRAYHALPPLTKNGQPVQAVYGFFSMFLQILFDLHPKYMTVCFDRPKPTFRQQLYAGYQQHRPSVTDDFVSQIILVHKLLETLTVPIFEIDGYEADDLIGTLANQKSNLKNQNLETIIVSGDRDMLQLVNEHVKVLMPLVGLTKTALFGVSDVLQKYGVESSQFVDYKALIGDSSDGYPGVSGIGPKTASKLIQQFGTFENLYTNLDKLPEKISVKLATDAEQAALAKKLATIACDAPIQFDLKKCSVAEFDVDALKEAFIELEFHSLLKRLDDKIRKGNEVKKVEEKVQSQKKQDEQLGLL